MEFKLGMTVKAASNKSLGTPNSRGIIITMNLINEEIIYMVQGVNTYCYNYKECDLSPIRTQTLFAYSDGKDQIHWITREYSNMESSRMDFYRKVEFDKTIELD